MAVFLLGLRNRSVCVHGWMDVFAPAGGLTADFKCTGRQIRELISILIYLLMYVYYDQQSS